MLSIDHVIHFIGHVGQPDYILMSEDTFTCFLSDPGIAEIMPNFGNRAENPQIHNSNLIGILVGYCFGISVIWMQWCKEYDSTEDYFVRDSIVYNEHGERIGTIDYSLIAVDNTIQEIDF